MCGQAAQIESKPEQKQIEKPKFKKGDSHPIITLAKYYQGCWIYAGITSHAYILTRPDSYNHYLYTDGQEHSWKAGDEGKVYFSTEKDAKLAVLAYKK